jgi:lauroyl/myristoyl acyltransferase
MSPDIAEDRAPIVDQLAMRYPNRPRQEIESIVDRCWQSFADAAVRSFVPVLVSRQAAAELRRG